jgi:predicted AlkP superfamily phosphohydrolase/phosphomutase
VLVIGLDSASPFLIEKWKEELPNLRGMMARGTYGKLASVIPPESCPAWNCFATGKNPAKLGVFHFLNLTGKGEIQIVDSSSTQAANPIWEIIGRKDMRSVVLTVPGTYPPFPLNGVMVSGFPTPFSSEYTYPAGLRKELDDLVGGYEVDVIATAPGQMKGGEGAYLREVERVHEKTLKAAMHLIHNQQWNLFLVVFRALDLVQHHFWAHMEKGEKNPAEPYGDVIKNWYVRADRTVGALLQEVGDDAWVFVISDHGAGLADGYFHLNELLRQVGLLTVTRKLDGQGRGLSHRWRSYAVRHISPDLARTLKPIIPSSLFVKLSDRRARTTQIQTLLESIDWPKTKAFGIGGETFRVYVNRKSFWNRGIVEQVEASGVSQGIIDELHKVEKVVGGLSFNIYKKSENYSGPFLEQAPDLCVEAFYGGAKCQTGFSVGHGEILGDSEASYSGRHLRDGVWFLTGPGVNQGRSFDASLLDICPTILCLLGTEIPSDIDGKVLQDAFAPELMKSRKILTVSLGREEGAQGHVFTPEEEEEIKRRLAGLGYLE